MTLPFSKPKSVTVFSYLLADDHLIFRQALRASIDADNNFQCAGEAANGLELLALLKTRQPDALILDYSMPKLDGRQTIPLVRQLYPGMPILVLTMQDSRQLLVSLVEAGANAILLKGEAEVDEVKKALRSTIENGYYFNNYLNRPLLDTLFTSGKNGKTPKGYVRLNENEIDLLQLICAGKPAVEICASLHTSMRTLERMRANLMQKVGVQNVTELIVYAMRNGFYR